MRYLLAFTLLLCAATAVAAEPVQYGDRIKLTPDGDAYRIEAAPVPQPPVVELPQFLGHGIPNFSYQPTVISVKSGDAIDPATWGGVLPNADDRVVIAHGHTVDLPEGTSITSYSLGIWGELRPRGGEWRAKDFQVIDYGGKRGLLNVEGAWGKLVIRDIAPTDAIQWGTALIVQGDWTGKARNARTGAVYAAGEIPAGVERIKLEHVPKDWQVGDPIALPRMSQSTLPENERNHIAAIEGNEIVLAHPTKYLHEIVYDYAEPWAWKNSDKAVVELPIVVNLAGDFEIRSENPDGARGHVVVTGHGHCDIEGVLFTELGRTLATGFGELRDDPNVSQVARYEMHFHHQHGEPCVVRNCVFDVGDTARNLRWTFSCHGTHDSIIEGNRFIGAIGESHLVTEDGQETRNRLINNIAIGGGSGYWLYGPRNYCDNNVAYGCDGTGVDSTGNGYHIGYRNDGNGRKVPGSITFPVNPNEPHGEQVTMRYTDAVPLSFRGNKSISCGAGLRAWMQGTGVDEFVIDDFTAMHCPTVLSVYYEHAVTYNNLTGYGDPRWATKLRVPHNPKGANSLSTGVVLGTRATKSATINTPKLRGFWRGIWGRQSGGESVVRINGGEIASVDMDLHKQAWGAAKLYFDGVTMLNPSTRKIAMDLGGLYNHLPDVVVVDGERIYYSQQADPDFVWRTAKWDFSGKTNAELWEQGVFLCGAKPPCEATRPGIAGIVCGEATNTKGE